MPEETERRVDLAIMLTEIRKDIAAIKETSERTYTTLHGNGKEGLVTVVSGNTRSIKFLQKMALGGGSVGAIGATLLKVLG